MTAKLNLMSAKKMRKLNVTSGLPIIILLMALYMLFRNYGVYPSVLDEYTYSSSSRLLNVGDTITPNYLYKIVFRASNICGAGWLECARLINIVFYVLSIPLIFLVAKKYLTEKKALYISILSILGPMSTYTAYFMPESMYFFFFWLLILRLVSLKSLEHAVKILEISVIIGLLSLIKPHAFFLIIPIYLYGIYINYIIKNNLLFWTIKYLIILFLGIISTKFLVAYLFSGREGLSLFGAGYNGVGTLIFTFAFASVGNFLKVIGEIFRQMTGHWMALSIIFGPLMCILINEIFSKTKVVGLDSDSSNISMERTNFFVLTLLMTFCMTSISSFFAAGMGVQIEAEASRLHMRYYNFILPMILISGMLGFDGGSLKKRAIISAPFILLTLYAIIFAFAMLVPNYVDSPEMRGIYANQHLFYIFSLTSLAIIILWIKNPTLGLKLFIFLIYPVYILTSNYYINIELRNRMHLSPYDKAAIFSAQYLPKNDTSNMVLVAPPAALGILVLSQIYIDNPNVAIATLPEGSILNKDSLGRSFKWIVATGNYALGLPSSFKLKFDGFQIHRVDSISEIIDFNVDRWPGYIDYVKGLGPAEPWGRWSRSKVVEIKFINPLPVNFALRIKASPFGKNLNQNFLVIVGKEEKSFSMSGNNQDVVIDFDNLSNSQLIKIIVPHPSKDEGPMQGLGLGLIKMEIVSKKVD